MIRWLLSLFGLGPKSAQRPPPRPAAISPRREEKIAGVSPSPQEPAPTPDFLMALAADAELSDLQAFSPDDRVFLSGILKRVRENQLEIPLLPQAALEISRLLANPNSHMDEFVRVLEGDPALSVDVLRIANSAFYGFTSPTQSVHNAVRRIGLNQIRGLIVVAHLHGKVLQTGSFQTEATLLMELSMGLAQLGHDFAAWLGLEADAAYTRGVLSHVEHFVIMGAAAEVSKSHQRRIAPTQQGLLEAFRRCGPAVRVLAAKAWGLESLMLDRSDGDPVPPRLAALERALVASWTGPLPDADVPEGLPADRLGAAIQRLRSGRGGASATA